MLKGNEQGSKHSYAWLRLLSSGDHVFLLRSVFVVAFQCLLFRIVSNARRKLVVNPL